MPLYIKTPLIDMLDHCTDNQTVKLKMEAYQPSGSFKLRGIETLCEYAASAGATHFISSSGGNAGLAVAFTGRKLGVKVTVVLPKSTPYFMIDKLIKEGASVIVHGEAWDEANTYALSLSETKDTTYIPPFDHPKLWEGHATIVDELKEDCKTQPDLIILSVGGGGMLCGVVEGLIKNEWTDTHILAVETEDCASLYQSVKSDKLVCLDSINTIATSLGVKQISAKTFENAKQYNVIPYLVSDESTAKACVRFADDYRILIEPACGASLSVIYDNADILKCFSNIVVIVCGGSNINIDKINQWKEKYKL